MQVITLNAANANEVHWTQKLRGRCEVNFQTYIEDINSLTVFVRHFDNEGQEIEPVGDQYYEAIHIWTGGPLNGFSFDKKNSTYQLGFISDAASGTVITAIVA